MELKREREVGKPLVQRSSRETDEPSKVSIPELADGHKPVASEPITAVTDDTHSKSKGDNNVKVDTESAIIKVSDTNHIQISMVH